MPPGRRDNSNERGAARKEGGREEMGPRPGRGKLGRGTRTHGIGGAKGQSGNEPTRLHNEFKGPITGDSSYCKGEMQTTRVPGGHVHTKKEKFPEKWGNFRKRK